MKKRIRSFTALGLALLLAVPVGCGPDAGPTAPEPVAAPQASLVGSLLGTVTGTVDGVVSTVGSVVETTTGVVTGLLGFVSCDIDDSDYESQWIGPWGGTLRVGEHVLVVPAGALKQWTRITAYAPAGRYAEVQFGPHGLKFERPVTLAISYEDCRPVGTEGRTPTIVFTDDARTILEVLQTNQDYRNQRVVGQTDHFSSYILAE
jgi:hypothetical protein